MNVYGRFQAPQAKILSFWCSKNTIPKGKSIRKCHKCENFRLRRLRDPPHALGLTHGIPP